MCGRFALTDSSADVRNFFSGVDLDDFPARYNIAPTHPILVVIAGEGREQGSNLADRRAVLVRWGFTPAWVKDPKEFPLLINARAETAIGKASFRAAMRHRRVLIPASGFMNGIVRRRRAAASRRPIGSGRAKAESSPLPG